MARKRPVKKVRQSWVAAPLRFLRRLLWRILLVAALVVGLVVGALRWVDPPGGFYMGAEMRRLGGIDHSWVALEDMAPVLRRSVVAAEDAKFCTHFGFDLEALRFAIESGGARGASTITQQTVKNLFLWHGRSWTRKALEAVLTPVVEALWPKHRILEVYLNIAEFDEGVFGVEAAAHRAFGRSASTVSADHAARLAVVLPSPKTRDVARLTDRQGRRVAQIIDGAATIARDGRAACFE